MNSLSPSATSTLRDCRAGQPEQRRSHTWQSAGRSAALGTLLCLAIFLVPGCANTNMDSKLDSAVQNLFTAKRTPQQYMIMAVSSPDPDVRRDSVARISKSKKHDQEWAIKGFVAIALLESDPQTRCVALRALTRTQDPRAIETALKILNYRDHPPEEVWPPVALVRWDATKVLADLSAAGLIPADYHEQVHKTLLDHLRLDTDRHARLAAAQGLGYYPRTQSVEALIGGLRDADFAVVHACEDSLVRLTGHTHGADILAWEEWLAANEDTLFVHAGEIPESRRLPYNNRWQKSVHETKELFRWLWPGAKEE